MMRLAGSRNFIACTFSKPIMMTTAAYHWILQLLGQACGTESRPESGLLGADTRLQDKHIHDERRRTGTPLLERQYSRVVISIVSTRLHLAAFPFSIIIPLPPCFLGRSFELIIPPAIS